MADFSDFLNSFDPNGPNGMSLLGALAGLGQAAMPSRMPVPTGAVFGSMAGGMMAGQQAQARQQLMQQESLKSAGENAMMRARLGLYGQTPSQKDLISGNWTPDLNAILKAMQSPAMQSAISPATMPAPQGAPAPSVPTGGVPMGRPSPTPVAGQLLKLGYTPNQIAGVMGNAAWESSLNPADTSGDGGTSIGLWQWHDPQRKAGLMDYAKNVGRPWTDPIVQTNYMDQELRQMAPEFFNPKISLANATKVFQDKFEIPAKDTSSGRTKLAQNFLSPVGTDAGSGAPQPQTLPQGMPGFASPGDAMKYQMGRQLLGFPMTPLDNDLMAQSTAPPGMERYYQAQTLKNLGYGPQVVRQGASVAVTGPDLQYRQAFENPVLGKGIQTTEGPNGERTASVVSHYPEAERTVERAAATGRADMQPQTGVIPEGQPGAGTSYVVPRSAALAPGAPPLITGLAPQAKSQQEKSGQYAAEYGNLLPGAQSQNAPAPTSGNAQQPTGQKLGIDPGTGKPLYSVIPPASAQQLPQSPAEAQHMQKPWQDRKDEFADAVDPAQQAEERLLDQASIYKTIETGAWKEQKATIAAKLKSMGISPGMVNLDDPAAIETALHENYQGTLNYLKTVNNRFTQREFATLSEYNPNPNLQPTTNLQLLSESIAILRRDQALAKDWEVAQKQGWRNPVSWETQYMAANPLGPIVNGVANEIGPLKGMAPNAASAGAPYSPTGAGPSAGAPIPPAPAITKSMGGTTYHKIGPHWYPEIK